MSWAEDQRALLDSLLASEVASIAAVEEAFRGSEVNGAPQFREGRFPFLQCVFVELKLADGRFAVFHAEQFDDTFGVGIEVRATTSIEAHWSESHRDGVPSIHRVAPDLGFALGRVEGVESRPPKQSQWAEVELVFSDRRILLKAGDVCEDLSVSESDENILLFMDSDDVKSVAFNPISEWIQIVGPFKA